MHFCGRLDKHDFDACEEASFLRQREELKSASGTEFTSSVHKVAGAMSRPELDEMRNLSFPFSISLSLSTKK